MIKDKTIEGKSKRREWTLPGVGTAADVDVMIIQSKLDAGLILGTSKRSSLSAPRPLSMAMLRSPLVANWKSPPFADVQLVLSRVPPFALACRMR